MWLYYLWTRLRAWYACSIREPVVVLGRYLTDQELFRLKCVCVGVAFMVMASALELG